MCRLLGPRHPYVQWVALLFTFFQIYSFERGRASFAAPLTRAFTVGSCMRPGRGVEPTAVACRENALTS